MYYMFVKHSCDLFISTAVFVFPKKYEKLTKMKIMSPILFLTFALGLGLISVANGAEKEKDIYSFSAYDIEGENIDFDIYRGKVLLITNVACQCGYTEGHYTAYKRMADVLGMSKKFEILAFPCNQFGKQEPWAEAGIHKFVVDKYNVDFHMFSKVEVHGELAHPIWTYLTETSSVTPEWNFTKYLLDHTGKILGVFPPTVSVDEIYGQVEKAVKAAEDADPNFKPPGKHGEL